MSLTANSQDSVSNTDVQVNKTNRKRHETWTNKAQTARTTTEHGLKETHNTQEETRRGATQQEKQTSSIRIKRHTTTKKQKNNYKDVQNDLMMRRRTTNQTEHLLRDTKNTSKRNKKPKRSTKQAKRDANLPQAATNQQQSKTHDYKDTKNRLKETNKNYKDAKREQRQKTPQKRRNCSLSFTSRLIVHVISLCVWGWGRWGRWGGGGASTCLCPVGPLPHDPTWWARFVPNRPDCFRSFQSMLFDSVC